MTTGADLYLLFQDEIDMAYTGYIDPLTANSVFKKTYIKAVQDIYRERLSDQNAFDQISYLIAIGEQRVPSAGNFVYHAPVPIASVSYGAGPPYTVTITTELPHGLLPGDNITLRNLGGITGWDGLLLSVNLTPTATSFQVTIAAVVAGAYQANTGVIEVQQSFHDYLHYLYGTASFLAPTDLVMTDSTNTSPIRIVYSRRPRLRSGDQITIAGVTGNTNANGTFYVKQLKERIYALYNDESFQSATTGNGVHGGTATTFMLSTTTMKHKSPDEKGAILGAPTVDDPYFQQTKLRFSILPSNILCTAVTMDYVRKMPQEVDSADAVIDLERYYPYFFLEKLATEAAREFAVRTRDGAMMSGQTEMLIENP